MKKNREDDLILTKIGDPKIWCRILTALDGDERTTLRNLTMDSMRPSDARRRLQER